jgi:hypothetical protein
MWDGKGLADLCQTHIGGIIELLMANKQFGENWARMALNE